MFIQVVAQMMARVIQRIVFWRIKGLDLSDFPLMNVAVVDPATGSKVIGRRPGIVVGKGFRQTVLLIPPGVNGVPTTLARGGLAEAPDDWVSTGILPTPLLSWEKLSPAGNREWVLRGIAALLALFAIRTTAVARQGRVEAQNSVERKWCTLRCLT